VVEELVWLTGEEAQEPASEQKMEPLWAHDSSSPVLVPLCSA
jgi:hypothetical protein